MRCGRAGGTYISAQFTLVPGPGGEPLIAPHLKALRPFLTKGDFAPGGFGHALVDALAPADYTVEKVAYSALLPDPAGIHPARAGHRHADRRRHRHQWRRRLAPCATRICATSHTVLLTDGCAAFDAKVHDATLISLGSVTRQMTCAETLTAGGA